MKEGKTWAWVKESGWIKKGDWFSKGGEDWQKKRTYLIMDHGDKVQRL